MNWLEEKDIRKHLHRPNVRITLKLKMILLISSLILGMFGILAIFLNYFFSDSLADQMGQRVLNVAQTVALIPEVKEAFNEDDPASIIQPIVTPIREETGAEFIVVGNMEEIRYSHPIPDRIGQKMVGDDNERALVHGESYVSRAVGSLGPSMRGKVPLRAEDGEIIGVVSVGFLVDDIQGIIASYMQELWLVVLMISVAGIVGAFLIAVHIKNELFGLEPQEISHLLLQKEKILQSTHEGIVAVNAQGLITMMNQAARRLLLAKEMPDSKIVGRPIQEVLPTNRLLEVLKSGQSEFDQEVVIQNHVLVVNRVPILYGKDLIGAVASFRNKTEIEQLTQELNRVKQYAEALRAQTHEFSNKLYTISGLLQLEKTGEAIELIKQETDLQQDWIQFLIRKVPDPMISAILLGKLNRSSELHVEMSIDPESNLTYTPSGEQREGLLTILGNLLENALEAALENKDNHPHVRVFFTDIGQDVVFEIEDSGRGIPPSQTARIFEQGYSTKKGKNRGIGLALVNQVVRELQGEIFIEESDLGGACFTVTLPKHEQDRLTADSNVS